jgi:beta-N-acetylhexosaminidase
MEEIFVQKLSSRAAELFMAGYQGVEPGPEIQSLVRDRGLSGVILFARNLKTPGQVRHVTTDLQALSPGLPLLIATDQEGGVVSRITGAEPVRPGNMGRNGHGAAPRQGLAGSPWPGNMTLGACSSPDLTRRSAYGTARELLALGINLNLAPVVDVNNNPHNPVIGVRSFGADPQRVAELGAAAIGGCQAAGVLATAKHFPGHGDTSVDSHTALPVIPHDRERLEAVELLPFRQAIAAGVAAIMTAHVVFPSVEPEPGVPATLSHRVLTRLLREELGFDGLILTDCLEMKAIAEGVGMAEAAVRAILAGADLVLVSHTHSVQVEAIEAVARAIDSGRIPEERVLQALARIRRVREALPREHPDLSVIGCAEHLAIAREAAETAVTAVGDLSNLLPLNPAVTLAVGVDPDPVTEAEERVPSGSPLLAALAEEAPEIRRIGVSREPSDLEISAVLDASAGADLTVVATYAAHLFPRQSEMLTALVLGGRRVLLVAQRGPYDLLVSDGIAGGLVVYEDRLLPARAAARVLTGKTAARGRLPVVLE